MRLERTVTTTAPIDSVFAYLSDFTSTNDWDPGTVKTTLISGDGGVGTEYRNISKFAGRETELTYTVIELEPGRKIALRGKNKTVTAIDTMTFTSTPNGTEVKYVADFTFSFANRLVGLLFAPAFKKLGDEAEEGMTKALERL
jgi:uncharacterized protein YndB with AHSA1/START domain